MFDLINGTPVHPLVVHAVVVLLPLAILGTILIAVVPRWRKPYGLLVVATAALATLLIPVATSSGESLEHRVGNPGEHAELGDQLIIFAIPLLLLVAVLVYRAFRGDGGSQRVTTAVAVAAVVVALLNGVWVYRVGDSGAKSAWSDKVAAGS